MIKSPYHLLREGLGDDVISSSRSGYTMSDSVATAGCCDSLGESNSQYYYPQDIKVST